jgi:O-antigen/teichoic acid export membrane protein
LACLNIQIATIGRRAGRGLILVLVLATASVLTSPTTLATTTTSATRKTRPTLRWSLCLALLLIGLRLLSMAKWILLRTTTATTASASNRKAGL